MVSLHIRSSTAPAHGAASVSPCWGVSNPSVHLSHVKPQGIRWGRQILEASFYIY